MQRWPRAKAWAAPRELGAQGSQQAREWPPAAPSAAWCSGQEPQLVEEKTGNHSVRALETDDGTWIGGSQEIVAWAETHPSATNSLAGS